MRQNLAYLVCPFYHLRVLQNVLPTLSGQAYLSQDNQ
jgi:hypothetical protein